MPAVMAGPAVRAGGTIAHPHRTSRPRHAATDQPDPADSLDHEGAGQARSGQGHLDGGGPGPAAGPERGPDQARENRHLRYGPHIYLWDELSQRTIKPGLVIVHDFVVRIFDIGHGVSGYSLFPRVSADRHYVCCHSPNSP